jgi:hypothetical protein
MFVDVPLDSDGSPTRRDYKLSAEQANALRAGAIKTPDVSPPPVFERKATPLNSDDDDQHMSFDQVRAFDKAKKLVRQPLEKSSQASESTHGMTTRSRAELEACDRQSVQG